MTNPKSPASLSRSSRRRNSLSPTPSRKNWSPDLICLLNSTHHYIYHNQERMESEEEQSEWIVVAPSRSKRHKDVPLSKIHAKGTTPLTS